LPPAQSDLAEQTLKDPYNFDFLTLGSEARERDLELGLLDHIQKFLLELGVGFAFVDDSFIWRLAARIITSTCVLSSAAALLHGD